MSTALRPAPRPPADAGPAPPTRPAPPGAHAPSGVRRRRAWARAGLGFAACTAIGFAFAYCDRAAVFLNGRRVFDGTLPLSEGGDSPRMAARDTLALDLRAGPNELVVVSTGMSYAFGEANGGWGFAARLVPAGAERAVRTPSATRPAATSGSR